MDLKKAIAVFACWSVAFCAAAAGFVYAYRGRRILAAVALVVFVAAFAGMFSLGRRRSRSP